MHVVVDTNVLIVANRRETQASPQCVLNCIRKLESIQKIQVLVIDDGWRIIKEYRKKVSSSGQPGIGDAFLKWVLTNHNNSTRCEKVSITEIADNHYAEFPTDPALGQFDLSDRKFVAVALMHPAHPPIVNAVDSDWLLWQIPLEANGIQIDFLCPDDLKPTVTPNP